MRHYHANDRGIRHHPPAPFTIDFQSTVILDAVGCQIGSASHWCQNENNAVLELFRSSPAMYQRLVLAQRLLLQQNYEGALEQINLGLDGIYEGDDE